MLIGLNQNGKRSGMALFEWAIVDVAPPAIRRGPPRSEIQSEQGKPAVLPVTAGEPQGTLLVLRVKDGRESEGLSVMEGIGVGILLHAKAGRLLLGLSLQKSNENLLNEKNANGRRSIGCVHFSAWIVVSRKKAGYEYCEGITVVRDAGC